MPFSCICFFHLLTVTQNFQKDNKNPENVSSVLPTTSPHCRDVSAIPRASQLAPIINQQY